MYNRSPDRQDVCVCVSVQGLGERQNPKSGWRERDKGEKVGEEMLTVSD